MIIIAKVLSRCLSINNIMAFSSFCNRSISSIFPIKYYELPKFLFIALLMFCVLFIQNIIRALKDTLVNTMIAPETTSFLKAGGVMPTAFLIMIIYVKLINNMKSENIFYLIMTIYLAFFALFAFYLFPNHEILHLNNQRVKALIYAYPHFQWFILLLSNWSFTLFYIIAELWPNVIIGLLVWQFVNNIITVEESKRFYPLFALISQTGLYLSGQFLMNLDSLNQYLIIKLNLPSLNFVHIILTIVLMLGIVALIIFWILNHKILDKQQIQQLQFVTPKQSVTILESVKMVLSSRYIMLIATSLICYGLAINLVEGPWKGLATTKIYNTPTKFTSFVGSYLSYTGILTIIFVALSSRLVRKVSWFAAAIITPIIVFVTGMLFFLSTNFDRFPILIVAGFLLTDPSLIAINIGTIQNIFSKSSKYTLFDSTKEMSYVPLNPELKTKGKAAVDMIGTKLGKSISSLLSLTIFTVFPSTTYQSISVYLMIVFSITCIIWIWAIRELSKEYNSILQKKSFN